MIFIPRTRFCLRCLLLMLGFAAPARQVPAQQVLLEAEQFTTTGGWDVDQQCMDQMGISERLSYYQKQNRLIGFRVRSPQENEEIKT